MNKVKLKKNKKNKIQFFTICIFLIILISSFLIIKIGRKINKTVLNISEIEAKKITKIILNKSISDYISNYDDSQDFFIIEKNSTGNIQTIDLNSKKINEILNNINMVVTNYLKELENGKSSIIDLNKNLLTNSQILSRKNGIVFEIPIGVIMENTFLSNIGPKIPVRISINGDIQSQVKTNVENYGINNALFKVYININVSEQIILPLYSKEIIIDSDILIAVKMIQGEIPTYYFGDYNSNKK